jgi:pterin-4a-carbinolamine dehydratase
MENKRKNNVLQGSVSYNPNGNIDTKSDAGAYSYSGAKPHAVTGIAMNSNSMIHHPEQYITYTPLPKNRNNR